MAASTMLDYKLLNNFVICWPIFYEIWWDCTSYLDESSYNVTLHEFLGNSRCCFHHVGLQVVGQLCYLWIDSHEILGDCTSCLGESSYIAKVDLYMENWNWLLPPCWINKLLNNFVSWWSIFGKNWWDYNLDFSAHGRPIGFAPGWDNSLRSPRSFLTMTSLT